MESVVHKSLGNVAHFDSFFFEISTIDDELMRSTPLLAGVQNGVAVLKALLDVVGVENGDAGRLSQPFISEHADVGIRYEAG